MSVAIADDPKHQIVGTQSQDGTLARFYIAARVPQLIP
jgi:hypothetical protein